MLISAILGMSSRSTMDMDTTVKGFELTEENASKILQEICAIELDDDITFKMNKIELIREEDDYNGYRATFEAKFKNAMPVIFKIDITTGDAITYKEIFPLIKDNRLWLGASIHSGDRKFYVPDDYPLNASTCGIDDDGRKFIRVKGVRWFTNIDYPMRHEELDLYRKYYGHEEDYPKYDNYDAINVDKTSEIPCDYFEDIGVPITFLDKYNPEQFDLLGISDLPDTMPGIEILGEDWIAAYRKQGGTGHYTANMRSLGLSAYERHKVVFSRLIIRNKHPEEPKGAVNHAD